MHLQAQQGLMSTYRQPWRTRGLLGWLMSLSLIGLYVVLYQTSWLDGPSQALGLQNKWYLYGLLYTVAVTGGAIAYLRKHGNSRYNRLRMAANVGVQLVFGFTIPFTMKILQGWDFYFSYFWPLKIEYLYPSTLQSMPTYIAVYTVIGSTVVAPLLAVFTGKRWYCSWVCGCGALANTFGDPWRHLTPTGTASWRFEKVAIHSVLLIALGSTALIGLDHVLAEKSAAFSSFVGDVRQAYSFGVGFVLAGAVGTGLYPLLGPRVWCRNFCPMAALLGISQKVGRFRIRVKKDMCISCGNCTTYCEMGIDVRSYAQSNQSFTRASCVGCGMCAHVCPRGVLRLENHVEGAEDKARQGLATADF